MYVDGGLGHSSIDMVVVASLYCYLPYVNQKRKKL